MLKKVAKRKVITSSTAVMPIGEEIVDTIQGIICYPKLQDFMLPNKENFQQYMASDDVFMKTAVMLQPSKEYNLLMLLLDESNENAVDKLCQYINKQLYIC